MKTTNRPSQATGRRHKSKGINRRLDWNQQIKKGQVWLSRDPRQLGRKIMILGVLDENHVQTETIEHPHYHHFYYAYKTSIRTLIRTYERIS